MPSNIFANTGTNVSVLFIDKSNQNGEILLMDATKMGTKVKVGKNQKTVLSQEELDKIVDVFVKKTVEENFTALVSYDQIKKKNYSWAAGQYFKVELKKVNITKKEFDQKMSQLTTSIKERFEINHKLELVINNKLEEMVDELSKDL